jgi:RNA polymerase sigma factor (sigma-70 family)
MIAAIKRGDEQAFEKAYIQCRQRLYSYFFHKTASAEDSKDLLQTTFLKLWKYRASLNTEYSLEQHLFQIARTVFIDYLRARNKTVQLKNITFEIEKPCNAHTAFDATEHLHTLMATMPELRQKIFRLSRLQGYSYQEIAHMLSVSVKTVDNNITKALGHLRKIFLLLMSFLSFYKD